jgi:hypothetical protein
VYKGAIFNIVITPFRDMLNVSAVERKFKYRLNLRLGLWGRGQNSWFTYRWLSLSRSGCLNGVAAE